MRSKQCQHTASSVKRGSVRTLLASRLLRSAPNCSDHSSPSLTGDPSSLSPVPSTDIATCVSAARRTAFQDRRGNSTRCERVMASSFSLNFAFASRRESRSFLKIDMFFSYSLTAPKNVLDFGAPVPTTPAETWTLPTSLFAENTPATFPNPSPRASTKALGLRDSAIDRSALPPTRGVRRSSLSTAGWIPTPDCPGAIGDASYDAALVKFFEEFGRSDPNLVVTASTKGSFCGVESENACPDVQLRLIMLSCARDLSLCHLHSTNRAPTWPRRGNGHDKRRNVWPDAWLSNIVSQICNA